MVGFHSSSAVSVTLGPFNLSLIKKNIEIFFLKTRSLISCYCVPSTAAPPPLLLLAAPPPLPSANAPNTNGAAAALAAQVETAAAPPAEIWAGRRADTHLPFILLSLLPSRAGVGAQSAHVTKRLRELAGGSQKSTPLGIMRPCHRNWWTTILPPAFEH